MYIYGHISKPPIQENILKLMNRISFNALRPDDAYMRHWTRSSLVHVMACRLVGAKPLPETMMAYCQLDHRESRFSVVVIKIKIFSVTQLHSEMSSAKVAAILSRSQCVNFFLQGPIYSTSPLVQVIAYRRINNNILPDSLQWRNNERHGVSNHRRHDCLLNRLFRCRSKKT